MQSYTQKYTNEKNCIKRKLVSWKKVHVFKPYNRKEKSSAKKDQEQINTIQCLKLELTRLTSGQNQKQQGVLIKQLSTIFLALADPNGTPFLSSDKSQSIHFFKERYPNAFTQTIPRDPDWVFLELMVLLHIPPREVHKKMEDWLQCLDIAFISKEMVSRC